MAAKKNDLWVGLAVMAVALAALGWTMRSRPTTSAANVEPISAGPAMKTHNRRMRLPPPRDREGEVKPLGTFTDAMKEIDETFDRLKDASAKEWTVDAGTPTPAADAETIMTLLRSLWHSEYGAVPEKAGDIGERMLRAADTAAALHDALSTGPADLKNRAFDDLAATCTDCHERYRE